MPNISKQWFWNKSEHAKFHPKKQLRYPVDPLGNHPLWTHHHLPSHTHTMCAKRLKRCATRCVSLKALASQEPEKMVGFDHESPIVTPLKINGWNIIMEVDGRWFSFSNRWFLGSMLIFQGVCTSCWFQTHFSKKNSQNWNLPQGSGWTLKTYLSCHHLVYSCSFGVS